jgi:rod shape-determining protein MreD
MSTPIRFLVNFVFIMSVQVLLLNDIVIKSSFSLFGIPAFIPLIYPLVLLLMPLNTHHWVSMILGFITGMTMDLFCNTPGMHTASCVLLGFVRPYLLTLFFQQQIKELGDTRPTLYRMGITSFALYVAMALLIHHFLFYTLQIWSFRNILYILLKTLMSGVLSLLLILVSQLLFASRETKRA